jgi:Fe-S cluster biogenesis protein NfuA
MVDVTATGARIDALLDSLAALDEQAGATADELVHALSELYGEALARLVGMLDEATVRRLTGDDLLAGVLVLHDLHPDDLLTRVTAALDAVRPALGAHAGGVELLGLREEPDGAVVGLRLAGSCDGCPSSRITVQHAIERAVFAAAPEVVRLDVEGVAEPTPATSGLLQIQPLRRYAADGSDCPAVAGATP